MGKADLEIIKQKISFDENKYYNLEDYKNAEKLLFDKERDGLSISDYFGLRELLEDKFIISKEAFKNFSEDDWLMLSRDMFKDFYNNNDFKNMEQLHAHTYSGLSRFFINAAENGYAKLYQDLINNGVKLEEHDIDRLSLLVAFNNNHLDIVKIILDNVSIKYGDNGSFTDRINEEIIKNHTDKINSMEDKYKIKLNELLDIEMSDVSLADSFK